MTPEELRQLFIKVTAEAIKRFPASQYFYDDGTNARHGFTCGGYHLWLKMPTRGEEHFEVGPVPTTKVKPTEHLLKGAGTLPWDEVKAGMITPRRLQYYWGLLGDRVDWSDNAYGLGGYRWWYLVPDKLEIFRDISRIIRVWERGKTTKTSGVVYVFDIPDGGLIPANKIALFDRTAAGTPPFLAFKSTVLNLYGCVRAGEITKTGKPDVMEIEIADSVYLLTRVGGEFTIEEIEKKKGEKIMNFNVSNLPDLKKAENAEKETTNPPVEPVPEDKPVTAKVPEPAEVFPDPQEPSLKERLEAAFEKAETLKTLAAEFLKELKPLIKEVAKLEKGAADSAEVKELRAENKTLTAEKYPPQGSDEVAGERR